jgi:BlaI family transcriptional regulator, penicillinase repressor
MSSTPTPHQLGDLQLAIMRVLWARGEAAVAEVHAALEPERGLAPTTIATMLSKMEDKGVVDHRTEGRRFVYRPTVSEGEVRRAMLADLTQRLFLGDVTAVVSQLLDTTEVDAAELAQLRALIARHAQPDPNEEA